MRDDLAAGHDRDRERAIDVGLIEQGQPGQAGGVVEAERDAAALQCVAKLVRGLVEGIADEADTLEPATLRPHPAAEQLHDRVVELLVDRRVRTVDERVDLAERRRLTDRVVRRQVAPIDQEAPTRVRDDLADPAEEVRAEDRVRQVLTGEHEGDLATLPV